MNDYEFNSTFDILANQPPTISSMTSKSVTAPNGLSWSYGASLTEDPESLTYTRSLLFNGSSSVPAWFTFDLTTYSFLIASSSNSLANTYNITIVLQDDFNTAVQESFFFIIIQNTAPQHIKFISNFNVATGNTFTHQFDPIDELFTDPDNRPMTGNVLQSNGDPLPLFMSYNQSDNTLSGTPTSSNVGSLNLVYIATDDLNQASNTTFILTIKECYQSCAS